MVPSRKLIGGLVALGLVVAACGSDEAASDSDTAASDTAASDTAASDIAASDTAASDIAALRASDVPDLPFADNPDPSQCGIPVPWGAGGKAWLTGMWEGELIQPDVLLYDGHQRFNITGRATHGAEVEIVLYQPNPVLDYYFVDVAGEPGVKGWVPAPFLSFDPLTDRP